MKTLLLLFLALTPLGFLCAQDDELSPTERMKLVDQAVKDGLPRTAIEQLEVIVQQTQAAGDYARMAQALARRILLEAGIEGNQPAERVRLAGIALEEAPEPIRPLLHTLRAWWMWGYYQQNRWRFLERTATAGEPGEDFETWDLPRLMAEVSESFRQALAEPELLQQIPAEKFYGFLRRGSLPPSYRPTLYDVIAYEALHFYAQAETATALPQNAFVLQADSPALGGVEEFLGWEPETSDPGAAEYRALRLYQDLLRFHAEDKDSTAFLDADLGRLIWAMGAAAGPEARPRGRAALEAFAERHANHELSALALHALAETFVEEEPERAHALALRGAEAHPESRFGQLCLYLARTIEVPTLRVEAERVWNAAGAEFSAKYRNLERVYFRLIALDWLEAGRAERYHNPENLRGEILETALQKSVVREWEEALPPTPDFRERIERLVAPKDVKPGFYLLVASARPDFGREDNQVSTTTVWVSDLALITRAAVDAVDGFVLHAITGQPVPGATVALYPHNNVGRLTRTARAVTDENGWFSLRSADTRRRSGFVLAGAMLEGVKHGMSSMEQVGIRLPSKSPKDPRRVFFFTDRALYRPGQTVRFKGVALQTTTSEVLPGQSVVVELVDPNGSVVETLPLVSNKFGGFSGAFTAPEGRVTGTMTLRARNLPSQHASVNIEEYKRPRFFTEIEAPTAPAQLGKTVRVRGLAKTYADAPVDGAQVTWRVTRQVEWPVWFHRFVALGAPAQEIAHGVAVTGADGSFEIEFPALPEPGALPENGPVFSFAVRVDVTDGAGETRSAERFVRVGFSPVRALLSLDEWQTEKQPVVLSASVTSLDGESREANGVLRVFRLVEPERVHRAGLNAFAWRSVEAAMGAREDLSDPENWQSGEQVAEVRLRVEEGGTKLEISLPAGMYRAVWEVPVEEGLPATARSLIRVLQPEADQLPTAVPFQLVGKSWRLEPGETFTAVWGTGYPVGRAFVEILRDHVTLRSFWTEADATQQRIEVPIEETMRGGISLRVTFVRENRAYLEARQIIVPWTNQELTLRWERFTSKLQPGGEAVWTAVVRGPGAEAAAAEMVATLYDASLDQFLPHQWMSGFPVFRREQTPDAGQLQNQFRALAPYTGYFVNRGQNPSIVPTQFDPSLTGNFWWPNLRGFTRGWGTGRGSGTGTRARADGMALARESFLAAEEPMARGAVAAPRRAEAGFAARGQSPGEPAALQTPADLDLSTVTARQNLAETAFFFPDLTTGEDGSVRLEFTMPEALTTWRFLGFAHDTKLRAGLLEGTAVTSKDLMVQPNPPRFLREGDAVEFTVKITNRSDREQTGTARLNFFEAETRDPADVALGLAAPEQSFLLPPHSSRTLAWRITVPDGTGFLTYRAVAATEELSDGEEGWLPVLSRRILVTESLPLPIRGPAKRDFVFPKLLESDDSADLESRSLVVQMTSNPAWYAVMALPYLMEFPHQCSEQIFHRFYANSLARHIAKSNPKIAEIFEQWRGTEALDSPLEKNEDIKGLALEETPWLREGRNESAARRNVGVLFEDGRMDREIARAYTQLSERQYPDGTWPWFPGGRGDDFMTLTIVAGFGRLQHLGVPVQMDPAIRALARLDDWIVENYRDLRRCNENWQKHVPTPREALYLYARSFFTKHRPIPEGSQEAVDFYLGQARKYWLRTRNRMTQAHLALALQRFGDKETPAAILASLRERAVVSEELGMYWKEGAASWWWYRAPIETQALLIEAFAEVLQDAEAVEEMCVWLLKQKQTQDWKTTMATANAAYGLLLRGGDWLAADRLVEVSLGGEDISPSPDDPGLEAGTLAYERRFAAEDIRPEMGRITVTKHDEGVAWGALHWQYLADLGAITPHEETPLRLRKTIFRRENTDRGPVLQEITGPLSPGDELVVRIELRTDRAMEYVHLKDQRGSGTEPVNVLSGPRQQDGLRYYESTRDTASHFFIDYLPPGTYVFEYPVRVQLRGTYQSGIAEVMCMYAPEFNAHSGSTLLEVR